MHYLPSLKKIKQNKNTFFLLERARAHAHASTHTHTTITCNNPNTATDLGGSAVTSWGTRGTNDVTATFLSALGGLWYDSAGV